MKQEVRNLRVLSFWSNQPYYTDVEISKEKNGKILINSWNGYKELIYDENIDAWVSNRFSK